VMLAQRRPSVYPAFGDRFVVTLPPVDTRRVHDFLLVTHVPLFLNRPRPRTNLLRDEFATFLSVPGVSFEVAPLTPVARV